MNNSEDKTYLYLKLILSLIMGFLTVSMFLYGVETAIICSSETQIVRVDSILPKVGRDGRTSVLFSENEITYTAEWAPHSVKVGDKIEVYSKASFIFDKSYRICTNIAFYEIAWIIICGLASLYGVFVFFRHFIRCLVQIIKSQ
jgi:hypothetical protein